MPCTCPLDAWAGPDGVPVFSPSQTYSGARFFCLPCGKCLGCQLDHARGWSVRCVHEGQMRGSCCFATLTYEGEHLPPGGDLCFEDVRLFLARVRKRFGEGVRYFGCGEYGTKKLRPHYHLVFFGLDFDDRVPFGKSRSGVPYDTSETLSRLWGKGFATVQDFTRECGEYVARYTMKKRPQGGAFADRLLRWDDDGVQYQVRPEFLMMSRGKRFGGIGREWALKFKSDWFPSDFVVLNGQRYQVPRFYTTLLSPKEQVWLKRDRMRRAELRADEHSERRLMTRDESRRLKTARLVRDAEL